MRSLNLDQLKTLETVVEHGSFSAAARLLHMTQPAVSLQVKALEDRFGLQLVERNGRRVSATAPGAMLIEKARAVFLECENVSASMARFKQGWLGRVTISTTMTTLQYHLPDVLDGLRRNHPNVEIIVTNMVTRDAVEAVADGEIDFGLITLPIRSSHVKVTHLRDENMLAIFPSSMADVPEVVTPGFVEQNALILEHPRGAVAALVGEWMAEERAALRVAMHVATVDAVKKLVACGLGMSMVPEVAAFETGLIARPLSPPIASAIGLIEKRGAQESAARRIVRDALLRIGDARPPIVVRLPPAAKRASSGRR